MKQLKHTSITIKLYLANYSIYEYTNKGLECKIKQRDSFFFGFLLH